MERSLHGFFLSWTTSNRYRNAGGTMRSRRYDYDVRDYRPRGDGGRFRYGGDYRGGRQYDSEMRGRPLRAQGGPSPYDREFRPGAGAPRRYGGDYWWIGEHEFRGRDRPGTYDEAYRRFSKEHHPRFSPVGGMYPSMGGRYATEGPPRPLREYTHFSDWTRWF